MSRLPWTKDELILVLDYYFSEDEAAINNKNNPKLIQLSNLLKRLPNYIERREEKFRNINGVYMKLMNFRALEAQENPEDSRKGLSSYSQQDRDVWNEYSKNKIVLRELAEKIRQTLAHDDIIYELADNPVEFYVQEAIEGNTVTRLHTYRERDRALVNSKKKHTLKKLGKITCEACNFDFSIYGDRGKDFIEVHHLKPISQLKLGDVTKLEDLALLCANCHRMVHIKTPWLSLDELKSLMTKTTKI
jgi:5-methylcytosine-specific restriction protein A